MQQSLASMPNPGEGENSFVVRKKSPTQNEKKPGCLGYIVDEILPRYVRVTINRGSRIPIKQPGFNGK